MRRNRTSTVLILAVALAVLAGLAIVSAIPPSDQTNPSSRSAGKLGTLALYTWLSQLGLDVNRVSGTFDLVGTDLLLSYDPTVPFSRADVDAVMSHLRGGGDLVLVVAPESVAAAGPLLDRLGVQPAEAATAGTARPAQPFDSTDRVRSVPVGAGLAFADQAPLVPLLTEGSSVVAGMLRVGRAGRAYVLGDTLPLSNDGLRHDDSAYFVLSLLQRARGGSIRVDEYHHGEGSGPAGVATIFDGPIGGSGLIAVFVIMLSLLLNGRRLGAPLPEGDPVRVPSVTTYVTAMGRLFARSRQRGPIALRYAEELKRRIGAASGVDWHLDDAAFTSALEGAGQGNAGAVARLLARARSLGSGRPDAAALLTLARDVDRLERDWLAVRAA